MAHHPFLEDEFSPHPLVPGVQIAKIDGWSVIYGAGIDGYEVMDFEGEIHTVRTLQEAEEMILSGCGW